jgi:hypothetical protein
VLEFKGSWRFYFYLSSNHVINICVGHEKKNRYGIFLQDIYIYISFQGKLGSRGSLRFRIFGWDGTEIEGVLEVLGKTQYYLHNYVHTARELYVPLHECVRERHGKMLELI